MPITTPDARQPGQAGSPPAGALLADGQNPRRRWWLIALGGFGALSFVVAGVLAGTYRPLMFGGVSGGSFPGMPAGLGLRAVNTFGDSDGQIYVPPQRGVFAVAESIENSGPVPISIEAVTALRPEQPGSAAPWPLTAAGQALYVPADGPRPARGKPVAGLSLRPGQAIFVGIPVRLSDACYVPNGWTGLNVFYVKERFLLFTRWVAIPLGTPLIFHEPEPSGAGMACPGR
jgi:hypothetical protein